MGSALSSFLSVRGERGEAMLRRMFAETPIFRLIIDEVEKTLAQVDLSLVRAYARLVPNEVARAGVLGAHRGGVRAHGEGGVAPDGRGRAGGALPAVPAAHDAAARDAGARALSADRAAAPRARAGAGGRDAEREDDLAALLLSINCIAAGFGTTG